MGEVFLKVLNMSLTASLLILAVISFRLIFRKTQKWVHCFLWSVVAIRLICPFSIESAFGLLSSTEPIKEYAVVEGEMQDYVPSINRDLHIVKNLVNPILAETFAYEETDSVAPLQVVTYICGNVWVGGMIFLMLYAVISLFRLRLRIRESVPYKDNIMICDAVKSPFILGNIRPRIYLSSGLDENEVKYIMAHECAHLERKDHWWKPLGCLLLCVYWFNPLYWIAYILFCKDIELACDERVIRDMDIHDKKEYSRTLLSCARQRELVLVCPLAFGEVGVKERVKSVLNYKKPDFWLILVSIAACLIIAVCFFTTSPRKYQIRVTIPAGGMEQFYYSDEEISPKGKHLILSAGEGLGDTEIILKVVECRQENAYDEPVYLTPGMPVKMDVEKGAWFKIGVSVQNPTEDDIDVYVEVENVDLRIASVDNVGEKEDVTSEWIKEEINVEKYDVTHDGILDYIITSLVYESAFVDADSTQQERIAQRLQVGVIRVDVYEGIENSEEPDRNKAIWSHEYSGAHTGNGQLSIVHTNDKDWLLSSSFYIGQGFATLEYIVFSLNQKGEMDILDEQLAEFEMTQKDLSDEYKELQTSLSKYTEEGILIIACDIDLEKQFVRTNATPYVPRNYYDIVFTKFGWKTEVSVSNLRDNIIKTVSIEDAAKLESVVLSDTWQEGTGDCINDCKLIFDGEVYYYHSECGTFNDSQNNRKLELTTEQKENVNAIFEKYISLGSGLLGFYLGAFLRSKYGEI